MERVGRCRPTRSFRESEWLRLVHAAVGVGAGLERPILHAGERGIEGRLDLGSEHAGSVVERRGADPVVLGVEQDVAGSQVPGRDPDDRLLDGRLDVLLDRKSTRLNSSHIQKSRMPSSA